MSDIEKIEIDESSSSDDEENAEEENASPTETKSFCGFPSVEEFSKTGLQCIVEATKCSNALPSGASRDLYSAHPSFRRIMETQSIRLLSIVSHVIKYQNIKGNIVNRDDDEKFELLQECNDLILERVNSNLDVMSGIRKEPNSQLVEPSLVPVHYRPVSGSWNQKRTAGQENIMKSMVLMAAKNILRPQVSFKTKVDNSNLTPFEPHIKDKPNSIKPLAVLPEYDDDGNIVSYLHPYEVELNRFEVPANQLKVEEPTAPKELEETPLVLVNSLENLTKMLNELRGKREIAVDLEHHSYRTFLGITCLLQISTRNCDYIVDTLTLREDLHVLNEIFTDPKVLKVFHGADSDIEWLQRDLALYVVNMFDTHHAAKQLGLARLSLAYLLKQYCKIDLDKTFQLADWRIRPLPAELISYARKDTHYLLYIYDTMRNELIKVANGQTNILLSIYKSSTELCKKRYVKPRINDDSHMDLYRKSKKNFDNRQLYAFREIFQWRDKMARLEDESYGYVLPNHMMLHIAESLPREIQGILACCNPIPPLVRQHLIILHQIVLRAREQPLIKPITEIVTNVNRNVGNVRDINSMLYCPHDLSHNNEFRDDLPTLLGDGNAACDIDLPLTTTPILSVFDTPENTSEDEVNEKMEKLKRIKFVSPYSRYKLILPFAEQQRLDDIKKEVEVEQKKLACSTTSSVDADRMVVEENQPAKEISLKQMKKRKREEPVPTQKSKSHDDDDDDEGDANTSSSKRMKIVDNPVIEVIEILNDSKGDGDSDEVAADNGSVSTADTSTSGQKRRKLNKRQKNKQKYVTKNVTQQKSDQPVAFDYTKVDFSRFQGGSHNSPTGDHVKTRFTGKGKNSKREMKKMNKMFSFSSVNKRGGK